MFGEEEKDTGDQMVPEQDLPNGAEELYNRKPSEERKVEITSYEQARNEKKARSDQQTPPKETEKLETEPL